MCIAVRVGFLLKLMPRAAGSQRKVLKMKRVIAVTLVAGLVSIGMIGCNGESGSSTKQEMTIKTPGGTTTITTEKETTKSGDDPPAAAP